MKRLSVSRICHPRHLGYYDSQPFRLTVAAQKPCDFLSRKYLILCARIFPNGRIRKSCLWAVRGSCASPNTSDYLTSQAFWNSFGWRDVTRPLLAHGAMHPP